MIWVKTFSNFINALPRGKNTLKKVDVLTAHFTVPFYKVKQEETITERAIQSLPKLLVKPRNEIYTKHFLRTARQNNSQYILMSLYYALTN